MSIKKVDKMKVSAIKFLGESRIEKNPDFLIFINSQILFNKSLILKSSQA